MTTERFKVRQADFGDLASIVDMSRNAFGSDAYGPSIWRQTLDVATPLTFIASAGSADVGYAILAPTWEPGRAWFLTLAVVPDAQRKGVGRQLAAEAIRRVQALGIREIDLTVAPDNDSATRLYAGLGFAPVEVIANYYGPGEDRILMRYDASRS